MASWEVLACTAWLWYGTPYKRVYLFISCLDTVKVHAYIFGDLF